MNWKMFAISAVGIALGSIASADEAGEEAHDYSNGQAADYVETGVPEVQSEAWLMAEGGRMYDNWYHALGRDAPEGTNPVYPTDVSGREGSSTWRCKECHGWDYRGADGVYGHGSHFTGIPGITGAAGRPVEEIALILRDENHPYTQDMISDEEMLRVAAFVSRGQFDMSPFVDAETRTLTAGDAENGRGIYQTVCAACHGFDGRLINFGSADEPVFVGALAEEGPDEILNKILNGHPGVNMVALRAFPLEYALDVLAYASTLPQTDVDE